MKTNAPADGFRKALVLYAKLPVPGRVKSRLVPLLSPDRCADLYRAFVLDTLESAHRCPGVTVFLSCHPSGSGRYFKDLAGQYGMTLLDQKGGDLGSRMEWTVRSLLGEGWDQVLIIGTDAPTLPPEFVMEGFATLSGEGNRVVIGPSLDGGYYLIGIAGEVPPIFSGIPWSTPRVLGMSLERLDSLKIPYALLPFWYDVDTPDDFRFLQRHLRYLTRRDPKVARHTEQFMSRLL
ncbi:MAG: TIGR04282 family arsenosugar biosynthesis glycosyltransferase [Nitrospirae bacterium]|nr:TIGR04282 family arsenosugar biosynthesis glycosyltransferase [Nitrospirota bacterium]